MNLHPKKRRFPTRHACLRLAPQVSRNRQQCDGQQEVGQTVEYARAGSHRQSPVYGALFGSLMLKHQAERAAKLSMQSPCPEGQGDYILAQFRCL